jgi:hypothetical protein
MGGLPYRAFLRQKRRLKRRADELTELDRRPPVPNAVACPSCRSVFEPKLMELYVRGMSLSSDVLTCPDCEAHSIFDARGVVRLPTHAEATLINQRRYPGQNKRIVVWDVEYLVRQKRRKNRDRADAAGVVTATKRD